MSPNRRRKPPRRHSPQRRTTAASPTRQTPKARPTTSSAGSVDILTQEVDPAPNSSYPLLLRTSNHRLWRPIVGIVLAISLYLLITQLVTSLVLGLGYFLTKPTVTAEQYNSSALTFHRPIGMLSQNLAIATLTGIACFLIVFVHHVRPRWLSSVRPGLRWRYLFACMLAAIVVLDGIAITVTVLNRAAVIRPEQQAAAFLAVIILTSPFQAAAEEFLFRGYLLQAFGSLVPTPWFGIITSSLLFAFFHGSQTLPLFIDRFAFGFVAAVLVWRTGGLEAGIAAHIVNNISAFTLAVLSGTVSQVRQIESISWASALVDVGGFGLFAVAAIVIARRQQLRITTPQLVAQPQMT